MDKNVVSMLVMATAFLALFAFAEILFRHFKVNSENTRKIVHIGTGLLALLFPITLSNHWQVLLLCSVFAFLLIFSRIKGFLPSIHAIRRQSYGSFGYSFAVYISFLAYEYQGRQYVYFYLPVLILAICDPFAAYVGRKKRYKPYRVGHGMKTLGGSFAFFILAIVATAVVYLYLNDFPSPLRFICISLTVSVTATLAEAVSRRGLDNVTIPMAVLLGLRLAEQINV